MKTLIRRCRSRSCWALRSARRSSGVAGNVTTLSLPSLSSVIIVHRRQGTQRLAPCCRSWDDHSSLSRSNRDDIESPDAPMPRRPGSLSFRLWFALGRARLAFLDTVQDELVVAALRSVFHTTKKPVRRTITIAPLQCALGNAMPFGHLVVADKRLIADDNLLGVELAAARIEPLLGSVH